MITKARVLNWDGRLVAWAKEMVGRPFVWGETDCITLAIEAIEIIHPGQIKFDLPFWDSKKTAIVAIKKINGFSAYMEKHGAVKIESELLARAGDLLVAPSVDSIEGCQVVIGGKIISSRPDEGVHIRNLYPVQVGSVVMRF